MNSLVSASLALRLPHMPFGALAYLAQGNTDESYAINMSQPERVLDRGAVMGTNFVAHASWIGATVIGALLGDRLGDLRILGAALPIMFAVLLTLVLKARRDVVLALVAAALTYGCVQYLPGQNQFLIATVLVPTLGVLLERRRGSTPAALALREVAECD